MSTSDLEQDARPYQDALTLQQAHSLTGIPTRTIQRAIQRGALKGVRPPGTRRWYVPAVELQRWLQQGAESIKAAQ
jgi:excisionase family DNA binding protein